MSLRTLPALLLLLASGCGDEVHVRLQAGDCDAEALADIISVKAELRRADSMGSERCVETHGVLSQLSDMEQLLAGKVVFADIPNGGGWTVRVEGYSGDKCGELALLCGRQSNVTLPPPDEIVITVDCMPRLSTKKPTRLKECLTQ